ncbi:hypothetical protein ACRJ4W_45510 [Streptomyces sp. GLT-R25]
MGGDLEPERFVEHLGVDPEVAPPILEHVERFGVDESGTDVPLPLVEQGDGVGAAQVGERGHMPLFQLIE